MLQYKIFYKYFFVVPFNTVHFNTERTCLAQKMTHKLMKEFPLNQINLCFYQNKLLSRTNSATITELQTEVLERFQSQVLRFILQFTSRGMYYSQ